MRPAQALDFGLCLVAVMLIINQLLLSAQARILGGDQTETLAVAVQVVHGAEPVLSFGGQAGTVEEVGSSLAQRCAVDVPPQIELRFPEGTLLEDAHAVFVRLHRMPRIVCPIAY